MKLLLSPTQVQAAIAALQARGETHGRVYFYDTPALDLLSKGVILRLREGAEIDLTAKLRPVSGEKFVDPSGGRERYKCEVDLNDGVENQSFSVQKKYVAAKVPETGEEMFQLLSEGQKKLLEDSKVQIDWKRVKRIAEIQSTSWTTHAQAAVWQVERGALGVAGWQRSRSLNEGGTGCRAVHLCRTAGSREQEWVGIEHESTFQDSDRIGTDHCRASTVACPAAEIQKKLPRQSANIIPSFFATRACSREDLCEQ